jgi:hypothetical protein
LSKILRALLDCVFVRCNVTVGCHDELKKRNVSKEAKSRSEVWVLAFSYDGKAIYLSWTLSLPRLKCCTELENLCPVMITSKIEMQQKERCLERAGCRLETGVLVTIVIEEPFSSTFFLGMQIGIITDELIVK